MVGKGNLAIFESSGISEIEETAPTKIGVYVHLINPYVPEFFGPILFIIIPSCFLLTLVGQGTTRWTNPVSYD